MIYLFFAEPKSQQCLAGTAIGQAHQSWAIYHLMQPLFERWQPMVFKETSFEPKNTVMIDFPLFHYCISIEYNQRSKIHLWKNSSMQIFKLEWILKRPKIWDFLVLIFTLLINLLELLWGPDIVGQRFPIEWHFPNSFDFSDLKKSPFVVHLVLL